MSQDHLPADDEAQSADRTRQRYLRKHHPKGWRKHLRALRYRAEYVGFLGLRALLRLIGLERASQVSGALWRALAPRTRRHTRALAQLAFALPEKTDAEREAIARDMWENLGMVTAEALLVDRILDEPHRVALADLTVVERIKAAGGRGIMVSMHYGNWEVVSAPASRYGFRMAAVYQRILNPLIDATIVAMRSPIYPGGLHSKGTGAAGRLMDWVREGNIAGLLGDQRHVRGIEVPFFGRPAPSNTFPAKMARNLDVPLVVGRTVRGKGVNFTVELVEIPVPHTEDRDADIAAATASIHAVFEGWIRERPDQWMWAHRRWG
jgi:KDO2-lipid IV(A) lauroyltransferase